MTLKTCITQPGTAAKTKMFKYKLSYIFIITHNVVNIFEQAKVFISPLFFGLLTYKMERQVIILIVVFILIVLTGIQAIQLYNLKVAIAGGQVTFGTALETIASKGASVPSSIADLPPMVGGC